MKKITVLLLALFLLSGCASNAAVEAAPAPSDTASASKAGSAALQTVSGTSYASRFAAETRIILSDHDIQVDRSQSGADSDAVTLSHDIIYYEDRDTYESGNPYGEGALSERHSAAEAAAHTVVNITKPGAYRVEGSLSAGQIRVDLGEEAFHNKNAVVELILDNANISCTVAPAILFLNTYECDENWSAETAQPAVDTSQAGANLILEGNNAISGSHVARIYKDKDGAKKLWKQDGAIYSYMSMNVFGPGALKLTADNEGLDTELHLTIYGGDIQILSDNDGINTNEDGVSVTTILGGNLRIFAGLGKEGDGIDSNGYLVINGGTVISSAKPMSDAGLDSDLGSFINGGTVIAMGSAMDWAESDSNQVTMNLQFARQQTAGSRIAITKEDGTEIFSFTNDAEYARDYSGLILSDPAFQQGETYHIFVDGQQMAYTGTDVKRGGPGGRMPEGMAFPEAQPPKDFDPGRGSGQPPENRENRMPPDGFSGQPPVWPDGEMPEMPEGGFPGRGGDQPPQGADPSTEFYMQDKVNAFSGITAAT